ncbi:MAG: hypothetical protein Q9211_004000, partial [Gyalolechia sp. 1 TL-2023]
LYVGTYYEYLCLATLRRLSFTLTRTGGRSDRGIDLLGHWHLPSIPEPLRVLVQCKAQNSSLTPSLVRELAGIYAGAPAGWRNDGADGKTVAMLCGKKAATAGARDALRSCKVPVVWVAIEDSGTDGPGKVKQVLWNQRVNELGAEGVGVGLRYMPGGRPGFELEKEVVLTWQGKVWEPDWNGKSKGMKRDYVSGHKSSIRYGVRIPQTARATARIPLTIGTSLGWEKTRCTEVEGRGMLNGEGVNISLFTKAPGMRPLAQSNVVGMGANINETDAKSHEARCECDPIRPSVTLDSLRTSPMPVMNVRMVVVYTTVDQIKYVDEYDRGKSHGAPVLRQTIDPKCLSNKRWVNTEKKSLRDAEDTRRDEETPEATRVKLFDDQVGANAAAKTADAAQNGKEHDMPQLAFLNENQRSTVIAYAGQYAKQKQQLVEFHMLKHSKSSYIYML